MEIDGREFREKQAQFMEALIDELHHVRILLEQLVPQERAIPKESVTQEKTVVNKAAESKPTDKKVEKVIEKPSTRNVENDEKAKVTRTPSKKE